MPLPLPTNCRFDSGRDGVALTVDVNGRPVGCFVSTEALEDHFAPCDTPEQKVRVVGTLAMLSQMVTQRVERGDVEPIVLVTRMF